MAEKLTREQLKGLTAEEKIEYQRKQNAARVAAYRAANKLKNDQPERSPTAGNAALQMRVSSCVLDRCKGITCFTRSPWERREAQAGRACDI